MYITSRHDGGYEAVCYSLPSGLNDADSICRMLSHGFGSPLKHPKPLLPWVRPFQDLPTLEEISSFASFSALLHPLLVVTPEDQRRSDRMPFQQ